MKQVLRFGKVAGVTALLLPYITVGTAQQRHSAGAPPQEMRLVLAPQAHLQLPTLPIWDDSVEAIVVVMVPDSCKSQRHLCRIEASNPVSLATDPRFKWALRHDTLMVLSSISLQIRASRQSLAASPGKSMTMRIHYQNLDHAKKLAGTATIELLPVDATTSANPTPKNQNAISSATRDSTNMAPMPKPATQSARVDSTNSARGSSFGVIYLALAVLLILFFGVVSWLVSWSQRRKFQKIEAKARSTVSPFPPLPQRRSPARRAVDEEVKTDAEAKERENSPTNEKVVSGLTPSISSSPAVVPACREDVPLTSILALLHELNTSLQQVIARQNETNYRLAQFTAAAMLDVPQPSTQLSLFDMLNDEPVANHGDHPKNGNVTSQLRILFAGTEGKRTDFRTESVSAHGDE
ncbi:MAG: hypothetical protein ONB45_20520 [candidate division KSB1 bacterium]|nr:hypothetical protein [candidate division KSB1 bacterium]